MKTKTIAATLAAVFAFGVAASLAFGMDRTEYKTAVEPICETNSKKSDTLLKPVRSLVKKGKLTPAGARFLQASSALSKTYNELKTVEQPSEDAAKLTKWLGYVNQEAGLLKSAGQALKSGDKHKAQKFVNQLTSVANQANATVLAFSFHYCKFEPGKYT